MDRLSLWQDRHAGEDLAGEDLAGDDVGASRHADVIVVGAGITGLTTALLLARAGRSVVVLEARHVGAVTTGHSTAKLSLLQGTRLSTIGRRQPSSAVRDYVEANREGQAWVARFCADHAVEVQRRSAFTYATSEKGLRAARAELEAARAAGLDVSWVPELHLPFETRGGVRLADQLQLDPIELLAALAAEARRHGARVVEGTRVRKVHGLDPVTVETDAGPLTCDRLVLATNTPILDRGGFFARLSPSRSYSIAFRTEVTTPRVDGMYLSADSPSRSLRDAHAGAPGHEPVLIVGGAGHITGRTASEAAHLDELRAWTARYFPDTEETHAWSAQDYVPAHELPFAGPVLPRVEEILMAGGYAKWGMTNGVAAALALAARITGGQVPWAEVMRPWASRELRGLTQGARMNAEVGFQLGKGWLLPRRPPASPVSPAAADSTVSRVCTHLGGVVRFNDAERSWDCPLHGSRFEADGEVLEGPATCGLSRRTTRRGEVKP